MTPTYTPLETKDPTVFNRLVRFHVEHNYFDYVVRLAPQGKKPKPQGDEDHGQVAALVVMAPHDRFWQSVRHIQSRPALTNDRFEGTLEDRLIQYSKHYDGAILVLSGNNTGATAGLINDPTSYSIEGTTQVFPYIKFSGTDEHACTHFNKRYGHDVQYYTPDIERKLLPHTFSIMQGGKDPQTGTRTSTWGSLSEIIDGLHTYLIKVTAYANTGTGKVLWRYFDRHHNMSILREFFLIHAKDIPLLADRPSENPLEGHFFNPIDGVVGITRQYLVDKYPSVRRQLKEVLQSLAHLQPLGEEQIRKFHKVVSDFDPHPLRQTQATTILHRANIPANMKDVLSHFVLGKPLKSRLQKSATRILGRNPQLLRANDRQLRKEIERFLQGMTIKPVLLESRYCTPQEFGIDEDHMRRSLESYKKHGSREDFAFS